MNEAKEANQRFSTLDADATAALISAAADVALVVDESGVIRNVTLGNTDLQIEGHQDWIGRSWTETVTIESRPKVLALLRDASLSTQRRWRHINHPSSRGADVPVMYSAIQVGAEGRVVAFGRDLSNLASLQQRLVDAQQSMERDYLRLRRMETAYRLLFEMASEAVMIVDAATLKIVEANPAAAQILGEPIKRLLGRSFIDGFAATSRSGVQAQLAAVRASGRAQEGKAQVTGAGELTVSASLFRKDKGSLFLVRLAHLVAPAVTDKATDPSAVLLRAVESVPDGFVVTDWDGRILAANAAFVDMTQVASRDLVDGENLERWLGRSGVDFSVLTATLKQHGHVRMFNSAMRGQYGALIQVEVSATAVPHSQPPCLGFTLRDISLRLKPEAAGDRELPRSAGQLKELVGRVPLRDIVGETTDLIEQLCIEAALELTRDNRASAAEMLGLSRQSLYVKLRRYGLAEREVDTEK